MGIWVALLGNMYLKKEKLPWINYPILLKLILIGNITNFKNPKRKQKDPAHHLIMGIVGLVELGSNINLDAEKFLCVSIRWHYHALIFKARKNSILWFPSF